MGQQVTVVCEDDSKIEINLNCDENAESRHRLIFRLHPPNSDNSSAAQAKNSSESVEAQAADDDKPVEFVIKVWKYKGYLIVQHGLNDFSIYKSDGVIVETHSTLKDARNKINEIIEELKPKKGMKP